MTLVISDIEYGVRYRLPGDTSDRIDPVGSPQDAGDLMADLVVNHGVHGVFVARQVSPWEAS